MGGPGACLKSSRTVRVCLALALGLVFSLYAASPKPGGDILRGADASEYWLQVNAPLSFTEEPFAYRILTPLIVRYAFGGCPSGFLIVNLVGVALAGLAMYLLARAVLVSPAAATWAAFLVVASPWSVWLLRHYALVDGLMFAALPLFLFFAIRGHLAAYAVLLVISVLNKEVPLLFVPAYVTLRWAASESIISSGLFLASSVPAALVHLAVRQLVPAPSGYALPTVADRMSTVFGGVGGSTAGLADSLLTACLLNYGALVAPAAIGWHQLPYRLPVLVYALMLALGLTQATDWHRLMPLAFPLVVAVSARGVSALGVGYGLRLAGVVGAGQLILGCLVGRLSGSPLNIIAVTAAIACLMVVAICASRSGKADGRSGPT